MPRMRADQIIADLLKRVQEVNANMGYLYRIYMVIVYGSYVRNEVSLSAISLDKKWPQNEHRRRENERIRLARDHGRTFSNLVEELFWPRNEVILRLKARTRGLSLHMMDDFLGMEKDLNFNYMVLFGDAAQVAEQITRGERK